MHPLCCYHVLPPLMLISCITIIRVIILYYHHWCHYHVLIPFVLLFNNIIIHVYCKIALVYCMCYIRAMIKVIESFKARLSAKLEGIFVLNIYLPKSETSIVCILIYLQSKIKTVCYKFKSMKLTIRNLD